MDYFADVLDEAMIEGSTQCALPAPTVSLENISCPMEEDEDEGEESDSSDDAFSIPFGPATTAIHSNIQEESSQEGEEKAEDQDQDQEEDDDIVTEPIIQRRIPPVARDYSQMQDSYAGSGYGYDEGEDDDDDADGPVLGVSGSTGRTEADASIGSQLTEVELSSSMTWTTRKGRRATTLTFCDAKPGPGTIFASLTVFDACSNALEEGMRGVNPIEPRVLAIHCAKLIKGVLSYSDRRKGARMQLVVGGLESPAFPLQELSGLSRSLWCMIQPQADNLNILREWAAKPYSPNRPVPLCTFVATVSMFGARDHEDNAWIELLTASGCALWLEVPGSVVARFMNLNGDHFGEAPLDPGDCVVVVAARASRKSQCCVRLVPGESFLFVIPKHLMAQCTSPSANGLLQNHSAQMSMLAYYAETTSARHDARLRLLAESYASSDTDPVAGSDQQSFYCVPEEAEMLMQHASPPLQRAIRKLADTFSDLLLGDPPLSFVSRQPLKFYLDEGAKNTADLPRISAMLMKSKDKSPYASVKSVFTDVQITHLAPSTVNGSVRIRCAYPGESLLSVTVVGNGLMSPSQYTLHCRENSAHTTDTEEVEEREIRACRNYVKQASCLDPVFVCSPYNDTPPLPEGTVLHTCQDFVVEVVLKCFFGQVDPDTGAIEEISECLMTAVAVDVVMSLGLDEDDAFCHKTWFASSSQEQKKAIEAALALCRDIRFTLTLSSNRRIRESELHTEASIKHQVLFLQKE